MQRTERGQSLISGILSIQSLLAIFAMVLFGMSIAHPDKATIIASSAPVKPGIDINSYEVIKEARKMKAYKLMEKHNLTGAVTELNKMMESSPNDVPTIYCSAVVLLKTGSKDRGFAQMKRALAMAPQNKELRLEYARFLVEQAMTDDAVVQYHMVINQAPKMGDARMELAQLFLSLEKNDDAVHELEELVKVYPNNALAHKVLGVALARAGKPQEGLDEYIAGINAESMGGQPEAVKFIVSSWGNIDKAKYSLEQEANRNPDDALPKLRLAEIALYNGDVQTAKSYLIDARKLQPNNPEVHRTLGVTFKRLGDNRQALTAFMQSIALEQEQNKKLKSKVLMN